MSTCSQLGSLFNEGTWNTEKKVWEGMDMQRTTEARDAHYTAFLLGTRSLQATGCIMQPILHLPRAPVVLCILHLTMAVGCLLGKFVDHQAREVSPSVSKTPMSSFPTGRQGRAFTGWLPRLGKKRPIFMRFGRILLGALGSSRASQVQGRRKGVGPPPSPLLYIPKPRTLELCRSGGGFPPSVHHWRCILVSCQP